MLVTYIPELTMLKYVEYVKYDRVHVCSISYSLVPI